MSYGHTASGLQCSHGSKLDEHVPRPKMPKRALPPSIRSKLKLEPVVGHDIDDGSGDTATAKDFWAPGQGVVQQRGAHTQDYSAGNQKHFLRRGSGIGKQFDVGRQSESHAFINRERGTLSTEPEKGFVKDVHDALQSQQGARRMADAGGSYSNSYSKQYAYKTGGSTLGGRVGVKGSGPPGFGGTAKRFS